MIRDLEGSDEIEMSLQLAKCECCRHPCWRFRVYRFVQDIYKEAEKHQHWKDIINSLDGR
jgi:hypothetical protein